jgi:hypothetical protein
VGSVIDASTLGKVPITSVLPEFGYNLYGMYVHLDVYVLIFIYTYTYVCICTYLCKVYWDKE